MSTARASQIHSAMADAIGRRDHKALMQHAGQMLQAASGMASESDPGVGIPAASVPPAPPAAPKPPIGPSAPSPMSTGRKGHGVGNFIQGTITHPGSFTKQAKSAGESVHEFAEQKKHASGKTGNRARLALTLEKINHGKQSAA